MTLDDAVSSAEDHEILRALGVEDFTVPLIRAAPGIKIPARVWEAADGRVFVFDGSRRCYYSITAAQEAHPGTTWRSRAAIDYRKHADALGAALWILGCCQPAFAVKMRSACEPTDVEHAPNCPLAAFLDER